MRDVPVAFHWTFVPACVLAVLVVTAEPYLSEILSISTWQKLHLYEVPLKAVMIVPLAVVAISLAVHYALKAPNFRSFLIVLSIIALQTNGVTIVPGMSLIVILPFFIIFYVLAEALRDPSNRIEFGGVVFFAGLLLLLDVPYFADLNGYGPARFLINLFSAVKAMLVAFVFVNIIQNERHLQLAVRTLIVVAIISAAIGVAQMALHYFTGMTLSLVSERHETKPTFLGTVFRASALTSWSSWLADFLVVAMPLLLFRLFGSRSLGRALLWLAAIAVVLGGIFLTFTYAAWAAMVALAVIFPFVYWRRFRLHFAITALLVLALLQVFGAFDWAVERGVPKLMATSGMIEREVYLHSTLSEITRNPWIGSGFYAEEEFSENFYRKRVHNTGVQAWANLGLPGLLAFLAMLIILWSQLWLLASAREGPARETLQGLGLGLTTLMVTMFAEPNLTYTVTWFTLGLAQAAVRVHAEPAGLRVRLPT